MSSLISEGVKRNDVVVVVTHEGQSPRFVIVAADELGTIILLEQMSVLADCGRVNGDVLYSPQQGVKVNVTLLTSVFVI